MKLSALPVRILSLVILSNLRSRKSKKYNTMIFEDDSFVNNENWKFGRDAFINGKCNCGVVTTL